MARLAVISCLLVMLLLAGCASEQVGRVETSGDKLVGSLDNWFEEHPNVRAASYTAAYVALIAVAVTAVVACLVL